MIKPNPGALLVADQIAAALSDPETAWRHAQQGPRVWPQSLAGGAAGIALLHIERARTGLGDWEVVHRWLAAATRDGLTTAANAGLFVGVPALAFTIHAAAGPSSAYRNALTKLDEATVALTYARLAEAEARLAKEELPEMREFDLIRGLAGLGIYHLRRHPEHQVTQDVLSYFVRLTTPLPKLKGLPPWWTEVSPNGDPAPDFPGGHGNFGLAHGISAPVALLALAAVEGHQIPGALEAIQTICAWTDQWRQGESRTSWWWPGFISVVQREEGAVDASLRPRPSWCYGISGIARAQQLAGMALKDLQRQHDAETALLMAVQDPNQVARLPEIGLCHGLAGLLQTSWRVPPTPATPSSTPSSTTSRLGSQR